MLRTVRLSILALGLALLGQPGVAQPTARIGAKSSGEALPANFNGRISYKGTHRGELHRAAPPPRSPRGIGRTIAGGRTRAYSGAYNLDLTFNGGAVTGRYWGDGGINSGTVSGTRSGSRCRLVDDRYGTVTNAECTATRFSGVARVTRGRDTSTMHLEASAVRSADAKAAPAAPSQSSSGKAGSASPRVGLQHSGMGRCWTLGFAAPTSKADLDRIATIQLLQRSQAMAANNDWYCSQLYAGAAAMRGDVQGMASYGYGFSSDSPYADRQLQVHWCQKAYQGAKASRRSYELDAVNYFCPIETFAILMTPAERQANRVSEARAERISAEYRQEVEARGRAIWQSLWASTPSNSDRSCVQRSGSGVGSDAQGHAVPC